MKRKFFLLVALVSILTLAGTAQNYNTALGVRLGTFNGITLKHFISEQNALEGIATFRWNGFIFTGLYEWQNDIDGAPGLDYFLGLGAHVGTFGDNKYWRDNDNDPWDGNITVVGVDFIAGLEYTFAEAPFCIGLDWKPAINFSGYGWWGDGLALSIRYTWR